MILEARPSRRVRAPKGPLLQTLGAAAAIFAISRLAAADEESRAPSVQPSPDPCLNLFQLVSRPTVTTSACSVQPHHALMESGYTNETGDGHSANYPQALMRIGLRRYSELDLTLPSYNQQSSEGQVQHGVGDIALGLHYELHPTGKAIFGLNGFATFPTGAKAFTAGATGETLNLDWIYSLSDKLGLSGTIGYAASSTLGAPNSPPQRFHTFNPSIVIAPSLGRSTQAYAELFGASTYGPGGSGRYAWDVGLQRQLSPSTQIDVSTGRTLTTTGGSAKYVGFGFATRF